MEHQDTYIHEFKRILRGTKSKASARGWSVKLTNVTQAISPASTACTQPRRYAVSIDTLSRTLEGQSRICRGYDLDEIVNWQFLVFECVWVCLCAIKNEIKQ